MSKIVRIDNGIVFEIFETMPVFHAALMAQIRDDAPDAVQPNWRFDGSTYAPPPAPPPPGRQDYLAAVQAALDAKAQERHYDNMLAACSYVGSNVAAFDTEALALKAWRDQVWEFAYAALDQVAAGAVPQPSIGDFVATLPQFAWPA